jgi:Helix-hairpin-helix domain
VTESEGDRFTTSVSHHTHCFPFPRKYATGATKLTAAAFVEDVLEDKTGGEILPAQAERIATEIESTANSGGTKKKASKADSGGDGSSPLAGWKRAYEESLESGGATQPPLKKNKPSGDATESSATSSDAAYWYGYYHKFKNEQLKDILRWNRQVQTGTKDAMLYKVIDGSLHGRLARCVLCGGGRLKIAFAAGAGSGGGGAAVTVVCSGSFDEDTQRRIECAFTCTPETAPRLQPWYGTVEPTEEEKEEMDRIDTEAKNGGPVATTKKSRSGIKGEDDDDDEDDLAKLQRAAAALTWNLASREGLRTAAADMLALLQNHAGPRTIDLPVDDDHPDTVAITVLPKIGQAIATNRTLTAAEIVPLLIEQFGFKEDKQRKASMKQAALATIVACPENSALVSAFVELSDLYFKTGNGNAGSSYKKVVAALASYPHPITEANAKSLGSGKTKVANIGKSSADKIYEFVTTGTLQKLVEKRADAS